ANVLTTQSACTLHRRSAASLSARATMAAAFGGVVGVGLGAGAADSGEEAGFSTDSPASLESQAVAGGALRHAAGRIVVRIARLTTSAPRLGVTTKRHAPDEALRAWRDRSRSQAHPQRRSRAARRDAGEAAETCPP